MRLIFGSFVLVLIVVIVGLSYYYYNSPSQNLESREPEYSLTAEELFKAFAENETEANEKYLNKVIMIAGDVREIVEMETGTVVIIESGDEFSGISCNLDRGVRPELKHGESITIKGVCAGMLTDVILTNCIVTTNHLN